MSKITHIHHHIPKDLLADCKMLAKAKGISLTEHINQVLLDDAEHMKMLFSESGAVLTENDLQELEMHRQITGIPRHEPVYPFVRGD